MITLLNKTLELLTKTQFYHRKTLKKDYLLHKVLWELKDKLFVYSDKIWEYIIKSEEDLEFYNPRMFSFSKSIDGIYKQSVIALRDYIDNLDEQIDELGNKVIENYLITMSDELEQVYCELISINILSDEDEDEDENKEKTILSDDEDYDY